MYFFKKKYTVSQVSYQRWNPSFPMMSNALMLQKPPSLEELIYTYHRIATLIQSLRILCYHLYHTIITFSRIHFYSLSFSTERGYQFGWRGQERCQEGRKSRQEGCHESCPLQQGRSTCCLRTAGAKVTPAPTPVAVPTSKRNNRSTPKLPPKAAIAFNPNGHVA